MTPCNPRWLLRRDLVYPGDPAHPWAMPGADTARFGEVATRYTKFVAGDGIAGPDQPMTAVVAMNTWHGRGYCFRAHPRVSGNFPAPVCDVVTCASQKRHGFLAFATRPYKICDVVTPKTALYACASAGAGTYHPPSQRHNVTNRLNSKKNRGLACDVSVTRGVCASQRLNIRVYSDG